MVLVLRLVCDVLWRTRLSRVGSCIHLRLGGLILLEDWWLGGYATARMLQEIRELVGVYPASVSRIAPLEEDLVLETMQSQPQRFHRFCKLSQSDCAQASLKLHKCWR